MKKALDAGIVVVNIDNRFDPQVLQAKKIGVPFVGPDNRRARGWSASTWRSD
ncbi:hypothetical protein P4133_03805 [Pseudomonas aeruginosa]|nr:hypothetical protein [Pseudomonas aeruginosa]